MSSIMRARSGLMGVSLIGVLLVLRLGFGHPHPQARALHIPLPLALPGLNAASARVIAAGYRVSGFVPWHIAYLRHTSASKPLQKVAAGTTLRYLFAVRFSGNA